MKEMLGTTYYTVKEVCEMLELSDRTITRYIREGKLEANKIGKQYAIAEKALKDYLDKTNTRKTASKKDKE